MSGRTLRFRLAGINNQNFLMRDEETGTWWQQVSGKAISGPLKGQTLEPVSSDELTFGLWKQESPAGQVLAPVPAYEKKYEDNWEPEVQKLPTVIDFPGSGLESRDVVIGIEAGGQSRAYPLAALSAQAPTQDRLGPAPVLLAMGPDGKSVRAFLSRIDGADVQFFRKSGTSDWMLIDAASASEWNFQGCAVAGPATGKCLQRLTALKDYWFDWRNYHPDTSVYRH
ncbi:MAG: DUF3179 domain-containing protein [Acidobacteriia bacterium]|nr:DUF3179 domain-containing protein [Terriglobia bacterium]